MRSFSFKKGEGASARRADALHKFCVVPVAAQKEYPSAFAEGYISKYKLDCGAEVFYFRTVCAGLKLAVKTPTAGRVFVYRNV